MTREILAVVQLALLFTHPKKMASSRNPEARLPKLDCQSPNRLAQNAASR
jgi:hypothetical protein